MLKNKIIYKELSYKINGLLFKTHKELGIYKNEKQYADFFEQLLRKENIEYVREYRFKENKGEKESVRCICDFMINNKIILEFKAKNYITKEDYYQTQRYLSTINFELGIIVNFRQNRLAPKRVLNSNFKSTIISKHSDSAFVLWLTGLPCSGKTTLAKKITERLSNTINIHHLDGDEVRARRKDDLGFSKEGRDKNIELVIEIAGEYQKNGINVVASFIAPYKYHRDWGRKKLSNYIEVFVDSPLSVCEERDVKGMYKKARQGEILSFTGIDDGYEEPENPDIHLKTNELSVDKCVDKVVEYLKDKGFV